MLDAGNWRLVVRRDFTMCSMSLGSVLVFPLMRAYREMREDAATATLRTIAIYYLIWWLDLLRFSLLSTLNL